MAPITKILSSVILLLLSGCAILPKPEYIKKELALHQQIKECASTDLEIIIFLKGPLYDSEREMWEKDALLQITIKKMHSIPEGIYLPLTFFWVNKIKHDPETGQPYPQTFSDFPVYLGEKEIEPGSEVKSETKERIDKEYKKFIKNIIPHDASIPLSSVKELFTSLMAPYLTLIENCVFQF